MSSMSEAEFNQLDQNLKHRGVSNDQPCPVCGVANWAMSPVYIQLIQSTDMAPVTSIMGGFDTVPCAARVCLHCGYMSLHLAQQALGLNQTKS